MPIKIDLLKTSDTNIHALSKLLIEAVANGAAVTFMHPLSQEKSEAFWRQSLAKADKGEWFVFGAFDGAELVGTVTLGPVIFENQPFRADVMKLLVSFSHRRQGIAQMLLNAMEAKAIAVGRTLLMLDVASDSGACRLYKKAGWNVCGSIPNYGLFPDGTPGAATIFWKDLKHPSP